MSGIKRGDALIILLTLSVSLCLFLSRYTTTDKKTAKVYQDGKLTHTIELNDNTEKFEIEINGSILLVENGTVCYLESDCPDKLCQKFGKLSSNGDTASCVPNKTVVTVTSKDGEETADVMTY